jgi:ankyrin repeat protein
MMRNKISVLFQVDARDSGSWTPLLWACYTDSLEMASLLLQHNADPNAKGLYHCTGEKSSFSSLL